MEVERVKEQELVYLYHDCLELVESLSDSTILQKPRKRLPQINISNN